MEDGRWRAFIIKYALDLGIIVARQESLADCVQLEVLLWQCNDGVTMTTLIASAVNSPLSTVGNSAAVMSYSAQSCDLLCVHVSWN